MKKLSFNNFLKIDFAKPFKTEQDLIILESDGIIFLRFFKEKRKNKIVSLEKISGKIYSEEIFHADECEKILENIIQKYHPKLLGIVINLPNFFFHRANLNLSFLTSEGINSYLRLNFPFQLERFVYTFQKEKFLDSSVVVVSFYFISQEIVAKILEILQKNQIIPLFISPSYFVYLNYLLKNSFINFDENYLIFFLTPQNFLAFSVQNFKIEKIFWEEISSKEDLHNLFSRILNFLRPSIDSSTKIFFFSSVETSNFNLPSQTIFSREKPEEILLEASTLIYENAVENKNIIDFLPIKTSFAFFLHKLPSLFTLISLLITVLILIFTGIFFGFSFSFKKEKKMVQEEIAKIKITTGYETQISQFLSLKEKFRKEDLEKFKNLKEVLNLKNFKEINYSQDSPLTFSIVVKGQDLKKEKYKISQKFPMVKFIKEEPYSLEEIKITYSF